MSTVSQNNAYNIVCPVCHASIGGRCLEKIKDGSKFIEEPHREREALAKELSNVR